MDKKITEHSNISKMYYVFLLLLKQGIMSIFVKF